MIEIKINDPQPAPCPKCKELAGYQYSDYMSLHYTSFHSSSGVYESGQYSDVMKTLNLGKSAFCANCGHRLPFRLIRQPFEIV